jgi:hypothetical protein
MVRELFACTVEPDDLMEDFSEYDRYKAEDAIVAAVEHLERLRKDGSYEDDFPTEVFVRTDQIGPLGVRWLLVRFHNGLAVYARGVSPDEVSAHVGPPVLVSPK